MNRETKKELVISEGIAFNERSYLHFTQSYRIQINENESIITIDRILTGTTILDQSEPRSHSDEGILGISHISTNRAHHQMQFRVINCIFLFGGDPLHLFRQYSQCILNLSDRTAQTTGVIQISSEL